MEVRDQLHSQPLPNMATLSLRKSYNTMLANLCWALQSLSSCHKQIIPVIAKMSHRNKSDMTLTT
jgi:hypothetical protein